MSSKLDIALREVAEDTFASMAFMFPAMGEPAATPPSSPQMVAEVAFSGPLGGRLRIAVSAEMIPVLAANMLGLEPGEQPSPVQQSDAFKELANVVCGNLLPIIGDPKSVFNVGEPRLVEAPCAASDEVAQPTAQAALALEEGPATLDLFLDQSPAMADNECRVAARSEQL